MGRLVTPIGPTAPAAEAARPTTADGPPLVGITQFRLPLTLAFRSSALRELTDLAISEVI
jgi:hypothetical protein